jgi:hypothetical protein
MAIQAYGYSGDAQQAAASYQALGEDASQVFQDIAANPTGLNTQLVQSFGASVLTAPEVGLPGEQTPAVGETPAAVTPTEAPGAGSFITRTLLPILCVIFLLAGAGALVYFLMRSRSRISGEPVAGLESEEIARQAAWTDYSAAGAEPPMAQFMASYKLGDDLFDDSFSIDSPAGEFMGECGVGISETIGVGDPKKVTAFEVWLFDKNDIQTVTKVLMSQHAFTDDAIRQRLEAKGEPIQAEPGTETVLETQSLQLVARVVDMGYGDGALPPGSFFDRFVIELAVWPKG